MLPQMMAQVSVESSNDTNDAKRANCSVVVLNPSTLTLLQLHRGDTITIRCTTHHIVIVDNVAKLLAAENVKQL